MREMVLRRVSSGNDGTFGVLLDVRSGVDLEPFAVTLEDPWNDNKRSISCIPVGVYTCQRVNSPKFGNTFTVLDVPDRDLIRFHWGNKHQDTEGCVLVAEKFQEFGAQTGVAESREGFAEFLKRIEGEDRFRLAVAWWWGKNG